MSGNKVEETIQDTPSEELDLSKVTPQETFNGFAAEDVTAAFFKKQKPVLKSLLSKMSAKAVRRFVMNVAAFPLVDKGDLPQTEEEKQAAYIFSEMTLNKSLMVLTQEMKKVEQAQRQQQEKGITENGS